MAIFAGSSPELLQPGGASSPKQSRMNPSSPAPNAKVRAQGTFAQMRESGAARPSPEVLEMQRRAAAQQQAAGQPRQPAPPPAAGQQQEAQFQSAQFQNAQAPSNNAPRQAAPPPAFQAQAPQADIPAPFPGAPAQAQSAPPAAPPAPPAAPPAPPAAPPAMPPAAPPAAPPAPPAASQQSQSQAPGVPEANFGNPPEAPREAASPLSFGSVPGRPGGGGGNLSEDLRSRIQASLNDPMRELDEAASSSLARETRRLGEQYDEQSDGLNENFAARGLDASTIAATGIGKLRGQQATALADMAAQSNESILNKRQTLMQQAIGNALGLSGQDLQKYGIDTNNETQRAGLAQNESQFGRRLGFDEQNAATNREQWGQEFGLSRDKFGYEQANDKANRAQNESQFSRNFGLDSEKFSYGKGRDASEDAYRAGRDTKMDSRYDESTAYDRGRDTKMDGRYEEGRNYDRERDTKMDTRYSESTAYGKERDAAGDRRMDTQTAMDFARSLGMDKISPEMMASLGLGGSKFTNASIDSQIQAKQAAMANKMGRKDRERTQREIDALRLKKVP